MAINSFIAPACKSFGPTVHLLSMLRVLMKILSHAGPKKKTKRLTGTSKHSAYRPQKPQGLLGTGRCVKGFKFGTFTGRSQVTSWQWRG